MDQVFSLKKKMEKKYWKSGNHVTMSGVDLHLVTMDFFHELSKTHDDSDDLEEELSPTKLPKRKMDMYTLRQVIFG